MNRRTMITAAAALAASAVVPVALARSTRGREFADLVMSLDPDTKVVYAAMLRALPPPAGTDATMNDLADHIEQIGRDEGSTAEWKQVFDHRNGCVAFTRSDAGWTDFYAMAGTVRREQRA